MRIRYIMKVRRSEGENGRVREWEREREREIKREKKKTERECQRISKRKND